MNEPVGIIGVGLLGSALAERLAETQTSLLGFDPVRKSLSAPLSWRSTPEEVCRECPTVFLSLPTSAVVDRVLDQILPQLDSRHLIIDTTTGDPQDAVAHGERISAAGAALMEVTVAGSSKMLRAGRAQLFIGGDQAQLKRAEPLLRQLSDSRFPLGDLGAASRFKLVFNLALGLHRAVLAETLHFAHALGFPPEDTLKILQSGIAASGVMESKGPKMIHRTYEPPEARLSQHLKDVNLILSQGESHGAHLELSHVHRQLLQEAERQGFGSVDNAAVIEAYRRLPGESLVRDLPKTPLL